MLRNIFKIAYRNLLRNKIYTLINISGLAIGLTCCLLITIYVQNELSYEEFHSKADQIYRVLHCYRHAKDPASLPPPEPSEFQVWGNAQIAEDLNNDFEEVETFVRFTSPLKLLFAYQEKKFQEENVVFMDSTAFNIFSWKMISGNPETALKEPGNIVLTASTAHKYFGNEDPMGKLITVDDGEEAVVTGVMEDLPANSQISFDILISMSTFHYIRPEIFDAYDYVDFYTYFTLNKNAHINDLRKKVPEFINRHINTDLVYTIDFEPITDAYLYSKAKRQPGETGSLMNVYIFSSIAIFILLIACINFMNLSTARSMERAKEVGIRKSIGALRSGLIKQFLVESIIISLISGLLALVIAEFSLPVIAQISGKEFVVKNLRSPEIVLSVFGMAVLVGLLAGGYPALFLSKFKPAQVLKGAYKSSSGGVALRKGLVVFQFSLSIMLIAGTTVAFLQLRHLQGQELGFDKEQMLVIDFGYDKKVRQNIHTIKNQFLNHPEVVSATASRAVPGEFIPGAYTKIEAPDGSTDHEDFLIYEVDMDFIPDYGISVIAGRPFSYDRPTDSTQALIINEAAAKSLGYLNPEEAVGKEFSQWGRKGEIIGVTENFNYQSLHKEVQPLTIRLAHSWALEKLTLKVKSENLKSTVAELENIWIKMAPHHPFVFNFLDQSLDQQYRSEQRFGQLFIIFAILAIFIACLGLFGLATYTAEQRTREIGIRKVLGASVYNIVGLLSKDYVQLVILSVLIATPIAWYALNRWLDNFVYRTEVEPWIFIISGSLAVTIAIFTVSWQSVKAAIMNPVRSLRSE